MTPDKEVTPPMDPIRAIYSNEDGKEPPSTSSSEPDPHEHVPALSARARRAVIAVALIGAGLGLGLLLQRKPAPSGPPSTGLRADSGALVAAANAAELRYVSVATAAVATPLAPLPAPARVVVAESRASSIVAPLAGRVEQVAVQLGDEVKPGAKLVAVRSASLPELGRDIDTARASLAVKRASVERIRDLVQLHALPEKDLILAEEEKRETEIGLRSSEGKRKSLRLGAVDASGLYWLTASREGTIVERHVLVGMEVGPDHAEPLLAIASLDEVVVVADILEADAAGVRPGQSASVTAANCEDTPLEGTVEYVAAVVDPLRRTVAVRVRVKNQGHRLRPNAFAQVTFKGNVGQPRIQVPAEAVVTDGQNAVVFVRSDDGAGHYRFERRTARVGRSRDGKTEVLDGLRPGETYVVHGALLLLNALDLGM
ncbi:MAG TPA: efflux RND transporter periplasmic adaptor subunit [Polyangia bacterium]|nr:efflux RND transporter periplasmic adaptor subunit [Polyangia bacterium]